MTKVVELNWDKLRPKQKHKKPLKLTKHGIRWADRTTAAQIIDEKFAKKIQELMANEKD